MQDSDLAGRKRPAVGVEHKEAQVRIIHRGQAPQLYGGWRKGGGLCSARQSCELQTACSRVATTCIFTEVLPAPFPTPSRVPSPAGPGQPLWRCASCWSHSADGPSAGKTAVPLGSLPEEGGGLVSG